MKSIKIIGLSVCLFVFGFGVAYADVDTPQFFVPVTATVMEAQVQVQPNVEGLNFGQLLPRTSGSAAYVLMDVGTVGQTANPTGAQAIADDVGSTTTDASGGGGNDMSDVVLDGVTRTAGGFTLLSDIAASVTIAFDDELVLTSDVIPAFGSPETLTVSAIRDNSNSDGVVGTPVSLTGGTPKYFHIGGELEVPAGQGGGTYAHADGLQIDIALE